MLTKYQTNKLRKLIKEQVEAAVNESWAGTWESKVDVDSLRDDLKRTTNNLKRYISKLQIKE